MPKPTKKDGKATKKKYKKKDAEMRARASYRLFLSIDVDDSGNLDLEEASQPHYDDDDGNAMSFETKHHTVYSI